MIRDNYIIEKSERDKLEKLKIAERLGLIELEKKYFCTCDKCKKKYYKINDSEMECSCGNVFEPEKDCEYVEKVNKSRIFEFIKNITKDYSPKFNPEENSIEVTVRDKKGKIVVLDYCLNDYYFTPSADDLVIRLIADESRAISKGTAEKKYLQLLTVIQSPNELMKSIALLFSNSGIITSVEKLNQYEKYFEQLSWQEFEKFSEKLLLFIQNNREEVNNFILYLQENENSIFGSKIIRLGGAQNQDLVIISLNKYLAPLLESQKNFEIKKYGGKQALTIGDFNQAIAQVSKAGMTGVIIITTATKIPQSCWQQVITEGSSIKAIIIDKFLLFRIIEGINGNSLIKTRQID